jgi:hypothetical protein
MSYDLELEALSKADVFHELKERQKPRLHLLVTKAMNGDFNHEVRTRPKHFGTISLQASKMRKRFRRDSEPSFYQRVRDSYFTCVDKAHRFGAENGKNWTRRYVLQDWVFEAFMSIKCQPKDLAFPKRVTKTVEEITSVPSNAIHPLDINGEEANIDVQIPPLLTINSEAVESEIDSILRRGTSSKLGKPKYIKDLTWLKRWCKAPNNLLSEGKVLNLYQQGISGRLYPESGIDTPHVIATPNRIRKLLFRGMDLYDYDLENAHFTVFRYLCDQAGTNTQHLDYYLNNKDRVRTVISEEAGVSTKLFKAYLISWLYGATRSEIPQNWLAKKYGIQKIKELRKFKFLEKLYKEIVSGRNAIVKSWPINNGQILNVLGKPLTETNSSKKLAHILFGYETKIIEIATKTASVPIHAIIFDGWISPKVNVSAIETAIFKQLNIPVAIKQTKF